MERRSGQGVPNLGPQTKTDRNRMSVRAVKHLSWIVTLPLMLALVIFSLANRGDVSLDLWPFKEDITLPLSWLLLAALFVGLLIGGVIVWLSGTRNRRRARELRFDKTYLEREVIRLKREVERAKGAAAVSSSHALPPSASNGSGRARSLPAATAGH
jgi:uncharacterized integral membrane protein